MRRTWGGGVEKVRRKIGGSEDEVRRKGGGHECIYIYIYICSSHIER